MNIKLDDLSGVKTQQLIREHLEHMSSQSPPESTHALGLSKLKHPSITFWTAWEGEDLLGCGALKELGPDHGELKSMRTATEHLRKGVAHAMLLHIISVAKQRGYKRLSLETGSMEGFLPARRLYEQFGFTYTTPFADYKEDPNSVFMSIEW